MNNTIKRFTVFFLSFSLLSFLIGQPINNQIATSKHEPIVFTLESYINTVKENNYQIKISNKKSKLVSLSIKEAMAGLLPQINGQIDGKHNFTDQFFYFEGPDFENIDPSTGKVPDALQKFKTGFNNEFQAHILLEQNLWSLKSIYDLKLARQYSSIGKMQNEEQVIKIITESKKAFLQTTLIKKVYEVSLASEQLANDNYEAAKIKYKNKLISEIDVLQAKIAWEENIPRVLKSKRNYSILLRNLKAIAGLEPNDSISLKYDMSAYDSDFLKTNSTVAIGNRLDYKLLKANKYLKELEIKNKKADYYPTLNFKAGYSYIGSSDKWTIKDNPNKIAYAGLSLTVPIFSGGYRRTQLSKAIVASNIASLESKAAKSNIQIEIQNLQLKLSEELESIHVAKSMLNTSQKAKDIAIQTAETGLISQLELRKINNDYKNSEINLYNSIYNYKCTLIDYNVAIANY